MQLAKTTNMGTRKSGLSTVGFVLYNADGTIYQTRTTDGISEMVSGSGIYKVVLAIPDTWQGTIVWDTGDSRLLYAIEEIDYRLYSEGPAFLGGGSVWTAEEKELVVDLIKRIAKTMKTRFAEIQQSFVSAVEIEQVHTIKLTKLYECINFDKQSKAIINTIEKESSKSFTRLLEMATTIQEQQTNLIEVKESVDINFEFLQGLAEPEQLEQIIRSLENVKTG